MIELSLRKGREEVIKYFLTKDSTTIGRSGQNDITLSDAGISRIHMSIIRKDDKYYATDKSTNGTFVNDEKITTKEIKPNDLIRIGEWTILVQESSRSEGATTQVSDRDPTRVLSYLPDQGVVTLEKGVLEVLGPDRKFYTINKSIFSIGKSKSNDIVINDEFVSASHCKIETRGGVFTLKDLESTNGTFLNDKKVLETVLQPNSTIRVGNVEIRFISTEEKTTIKPSESDAFEGMQSKDPTMRKIFSLIERISSADDTVLVIGETGAGKELIAAALHRRSGRAAKPFVAINCGAISKDLIESELFGHEKGAFTSAHQQRKGVFEQAQGGTLFLDEIGELPLDLQPKLLRVLEMREIKRVGGTQTIPVDVRLVAATHRDLAAEVRNGRFREDLYYRLYVIPVSVPPLRSRKGDIPLLADFFLKQELVKGKSKGGLKKLDAEAMDKLKDYDWPGNIREFKNVISRAVVNCQTSEISSGDIVFAPAGATASTHHEYDEKTIRIQQTSPKTLREVEKARILTELKKNNWNKKATAKVLGIAKSTLHEKLKKYDIKDEEP
jgi:DNA-binding NtrC family response regulator